MKRAAVISLVSLIALLAAVAAFWVTHLPPQPPSDLEPLGEIIPVNSGGVVTYLIAKPEAPLVLINSGSDADATAVLAAIDALGRKPEEVRAVLLTHGSYDHSAGLSHFPRATIYASSDDLDLVDHVRRIQSAAPRLRMRLFGRPERPAKMRTALPGELLRIGPVEIECVGLPGVTRGSLAFRYGEVTFVGDSLWQEGETLSLPPTLWLEAPETLVASLPRLERGGWLATSRSGIIEKPASLPP